MKYIAPLVALCMGVATATSVEETAVDTAFGLWKKQFGKSYASPEEEASRKAIFQESLGRIAAYPSGRSWKAGVNAFSDLTWDEFKATKLASGAQNCSATHAVGTWEAKTGAVVPDAIDWREKGAVSPVKNQGSCGSCWTFSTTGCLESHHYLATGEMALFAEQQLVDCAQAFDNHGCSGGLPSHAFEYIKFAGGMMTEDDYPCKPPPSPPRPVQPPVSRWDTHQPVSLLTVRAWVGAAYRHR